MSPRKAPFHVSKRHLGVLKAKRFFFASAILAAAFLSISTLLLQKPTHNRAQHVSAAEQLSYSGPKNANDGNKLLHLPISNLIEDEETWRRRQGQCVLTSCSDKNIPMQLQRTYQFCNSLDWEEPLNQRICSATRMTKSRTCQPMPDFHTDMLHSQRFLEQHSSHRFQLTVHYVFHESGDELPGELQNKRVNLEFFIQEALFKSPPSVQFYFSYAGRLPSPREYFASLGASPTLFRDSVIPTHLDNVHLVVQRKPSSTDLCHHGRWLNSYKNATTTGPTNFVLFLNDGVRGPFVTEEYARQYQYFQQSSSSSLANAGVPQWFLPFLGKFSQNEQMTLMGPLISSEMGTHVQSYAMALRLQSTLLMQQASNILLRTCEMPKLLAIFEGELALSRLMLRQGLSLGALFPATTNVTAWHDLCASWGGRLELELPACTVFKNETDIMTNSPACHSLLSIGHELFHKKQNPTTQFNGPVSSIVFTKFGGEVMRMQLMPSQLLEDVHHLTRNVLGNSSWIPLPTEYDERGTITRFKEDFSPLFDKWLRTVVLEHIIGGAEYCQRRMLDNEKFEWMRAKMESRQTEAWTVNESDPVLDMDMARHVVGTLVLDPFRKRKTKRYWLEPHPFLYLLDGCPHHPALAG